MSCNPGATAPLPSEMGGLLERSLDHLINNSAGEAKGAPDQLARGSYFTRFGENGDDSFVSSEREEGGRCSFAWKFVKVVDCEILA